MRKLGAWAAATLLVVAMAAPAAAQAPVEGPPWGGGIAERLGGWLEGLWRAVAGSGTGTADEEPAGDPLAQVPGDPSLCLTEDDPGTQGEVYPEFDPNGSH